MFSFLSPFFVQKELVSWVKFYKTMIFFFVSSLYNTVKFTFPKCLAKRLLQYVYGIIVHENYWNREWVLNSGLFQGWRITGVWNSVGIHVNFGALVWIWTAGHFTVPLYNISMSLFPFSPIETARTSWEYSSPLLTPGKYPGEILNSMFINIHLV